MSLSAVRTAASASKESLLEIRNLHVHFKTDEGLAKAVSGVDLKIQKGETLGLVGESGSGKTVTALAIMRLIPCPPGRIVSGEILFERLDLLKLREAALRRMRGHVVSMIFQEPMTSLNPVYRVGSQIAEVIRLHQGVGRSKATERALDMLKKVGISDPERRLKEFPHQMSGGMRQRVMIAMALSGHPKLLIADEPTTALDVTIQAQILDLMKELKGRMNTSILLITHDLGVIAEMAERVAVMYAGKIVEYAHLGNLFRSPLHPYTKGLMDSMPRMEQRSTGDKRLRAIPGTVPSLFDLPRGCAFHDRCGAKLRRCSEEDPPIIRLDQDRWARCWLHEK